MTLEAESWAPPDVAGAFPGPADASPDGWADMVEVFSELMEAPYLDDLTDLLAAELGRTSYRQMVIAEFRCRMRVNMLELIGGAIQRRVPDGSDDDSRLRAVGAARASKGVTAADLVKVILLAQPMVVDETLRRGRARGVAEVLVVEAIQYLDAWMAWETHALIAGHREADLAAQARERRRRDRAVRRLLSGGLTPVETVEMARDGGLDPRGAHMVLAASTPEGRNVEDVRRMLVAAGLSLSPQSAFTVLYGQVCAIVASVPDSPVPLAVGVSTPVAIGELAVGFRLAARCADAARRLGLSGFVTMKDLSVRAALTVDHEVVRALRARYISPFVDMGTAGEAILDTVASYLDHQRSPSATSRSLFVHANTIRYRLSRFEQVTRASLRDVQTIVEVWWILQARNFADGPAPAPEPPAV